MCFKNPKWWRWDELKLQRHSYAIVDRYSTWQKQNQSITLVEHRRLPPELIDNTKAIPQLPPSLRSYYDPLTFR